MSRTIKKAAVLTSGGDAPGMNAAIRAVVRTCAYHGVQIYGVSRGYEGLVQGKLHHMEVREVGNIIHRGGTVLRTARSQLFRTEEGRKMAYETLQAYEIDACIVIGGDGTLTGAKVFTEEFDIPFIGIPGTIDNDLYGTDATIGFDTACNTAIEAVDRIRDTADSHNRLFFIEVMGRHAGYIALHTAIGGGASSLLIPETDISVEQLVSKLRKDSRRRKLFSLVVVAEGNKTGGAAEIARKVQEIFDSYEIKVSIIGHLQRGGSPSGYDRVLASKLGYGAVEGLLGGHHNTMVGLINNQLVYTPLQEVIERSTSPDPNWIKLAEVLAI